MLRFVCKLVIIKDVSSFFRINKKCFYNNNSKVLFGKDKIFEVINVIGKVLMNCLNKIVKKKFK